MLTDPELLQYGMDRRSVIATPTTLLAVLKSVALSWQQHSVTENAQKIVGVGKELHNRIGAFAKHLAKVGKGLQSASSAFDDAVGSWESRIVPSGRRLEELDASKGSELPQLDQVTGPTRSIREDGSKAEGEV